MDLQEVLSTLEKFESLGYIKILNKDTREILVMPKLASDLSPINSWIDEYRNKFKGLKPGAMGDKNACVVKMTELFKRRPDLTKEIVLAATTKYINAESSNRWKYLMQADYFISKNQGNTRDGRISKLEAYCDEIDKENISTQTTSFDYDI